jgi:Peptidase C13 family
MKNLWWVTKATLRAAVWKSTRDQPSLPIRTVLVFAIAAMACDAADQYFAVSGPASHSFYGVNSLIAEKAVIAAIGLLFISQNRPAALAQMFAFEILSTWIQFAASRLPKPESFGPLQGLWSVRDTIILGLILYMVWWIGAVAAILRGGGSRPYESPIIRAFGLCFASQLAIAALPSYPTFLDKDFDLSSYNAWEWAYAKFAANPDSENAPDIDAATVELAQPALLEAEVRKLLPERKGTADIYAIGVAGWSEQDVFMKELNGGLNALAGALGMDRGTIRLVNHADTTGILPIANRTNFAAAVHDIAGIMNKDEDVLLIFITSHGGPSGVGLRLSDAFSVRLGPDHLAAVLNREGIKNRVVIVSACYSGVFVKPLATADSIVLTAADDSSASFGCSNERDWTYFGDALFNQNLGSDVSLEEAFENARVKIAQWELRDGAPPSNPQAYFGATLSEKLRTKLGPGGNRNARSGDP